MQQSSTPPQGAPVEFMSSTTRSCCMFCNKKPEAEPHMRCGRCRDPLVLYCGKTCQKQDWKRHKLVCVAPARPPKDVLLALSQLSRAQKTNDKRAEAAACTQLGIYASRYGQPQRAIEYHTKASRGFAELDDRKCQGISLCHIGSAYKIMGDPTEAHSWYTKYLNLAQTEPVMKKAQAIAYISLADCHAALAEVNQAFTMYNKALSISQKLGDQVLEGTAFCGIGHVHMLLASSVAKRSPLGSPLGSGLEERMAHLDKATAFYEKDLAIALKLNDGRTAGVCRGLIGVALCGSGNPTAAIDMFKLAEASAVEFKDHYGQLCASHTLSLAYDLSGEGDAADKLRQKTLEIKQGLAAEPNHFLFR